MMNNSRRLLALLILPLAVAVLWLAYGSGDASQQAGAEPPAAGGSAEAHLQQAAESIAAAAKQSVPSAASDEEAVNRIHVSLEALRLIGLLSDADIESRTAKMLDVLQQGARPAVAESIIQMRLARQIRQWSDLSEPQRKEAIDRYVADVKQNGLTPGHADLLIRISDILEQAKDEQLAADAINQLLPEFRNAKQPGISRRAPWMEGIARRLTLVGKPLELEGTLLDGSQLDWDSYRGKVVLIDFFADWCEVCRAEAPNVVANYRAYRDKGFEVIGVSMDDHRARAEAYRRQTGFNFPTLFSDDPKAAGRDHPMGLKYGVTGLPRAILVDKNGVVVDTVARGQRLGRHLRDLLGPPGAPINGGRFGDLDTEPMDEFGGEAASILPAGFEEEATPEAAPKK